MKRVFFIILIFLSHNMLSAALSIQLNNTPGNLTITSATFDSDLFCIEDTSVTYDVENSSGHTARITSSLNMNMPDYTSLEISLAAPSGATSSGFQYTYTTEQNLVTGIPNLTNQTNLPITYKFEAVTAAGIITALTRTVTFTIYDY